MDEFQKLHKERLALAKRISEMKDASDLIGGLAHEIWFHFDQLYGKISKELQKLEAQHKTQTGDID